MSWNLYESIHFQIHWLGLVDLFGTWMVPSLHLSMIISKSPQDLAASAPVSDLGIRRESVQDAIQKFMYHDDVRPKRPVMGWDLWCYVGGADGSCQKKHRFHGSLATFNDLIHPENLSDLPI